MTGQTLDQKRAAHALKCVKTTEKKDATMQSKYVSYVKGLPAAILMNGLGQALATERAASDKAHHELANHVAEWLLCSDSRTRYSTSSALETPESEPVQKLLHRIVEGNQDAYLWAQSEALAYLNWLKRFANAFLKV
jgi:CRISPR-associated protein Cmr5